MRDIPDIARPGILCRDHPAVDIVRLGPEEPLPIKMNAYAWRDMERAWNRIADQLQPLGEVLSGISARVVITARVDFVVEVVDYPFHMDKLCGETFEQAARRVASSAGDILDGGSGGGGGSMYTPVILNWSYSGWTFTCMSGDTPISCDGF